MKPRIHFNSLLQLWICISLTGRRELTLTSGKTPREAFDHQLDGGDGFQTISLCDQRIAEIIDEMESSS